MADPILNDAPWGYWPLSYSGIDGSGNGNDLSVLVSGSQEYGRYPGFEGLPGTRGDVVWDTGFDPSGDWTFTAIIQRNAAGTLLTDGTNSLTVAYTRAKLGASYTTSWGWVPFNVPVVIYLVSSGGSISYSWANWYPTGPGPIQAGSLGANPFSGSLRIGDYGRTYFYGRAAIFDYALSPWRIAIQMASAEPALPESAAELVGEMLADSPQGVWASPSDFDTIPDSAEVAGDATLTSGAGFVHATPTVGGFLSSDSEWSLPVALDSTAFTVEFVFQDTAPDTGTAFVSSVPGGDVAVTAQASFAGNVYTASVGSDSLTWSTSTPDASVHLVGVTWDSTGDLTLYVDGVARVSTPVSGSFTAGTSVSVGSTAPLVGVGTVAVFDAALSAGRMLAHGVTVLPTVLNRIEVDTFDRTDGPVGNTSLRGLPWTVIDGSPVVSGNDATGGMAQVHGVPYARGVVAKINKGGSAGEVMIGFWDAGVLHGVWADFGANTVTLAKRVSDSEWTIETSPYTVDLSAGTAELRFQFDAFTEHDGTPRVDFWAWEASIWVDGVVVASNIPLGDFRDAMFDLPVGWHTSSTGSLSWIDGLEGDYKIHQPAQADQVGGLEFRFWPFDGVLLGSSTQGPQVGGLAPPGDPIRDSRPVFLGASPTVPQRGGIRTIWTNGTVPAPAPNTPPVWAGVGSPPADLAVGGFPLRTEASCRPTLNGAGSGSFTTPGPGPALGDVVTLSSGGSAVFTGYADEITDVVAAQDEEAGQLVSVGLKDLLSIDWTETIVWPDFGAFEPIRVGAPPQDDREWGWPMNGLVDDDNEAALVPSFGNDPARWGTPNEVLPIPDNWPDSTARWMWDITPDWTAQPQGWVYFRVPFGTWPGRYAVFLNAWDYAKCWIDGAMVAEVTTPGQTVRFDVDFDWDFHLVAIAAYNEGGPAGVMFSVMKHSTDGSGLLAAANGSGLDQPAMNSRGGWKCLPYPERTLRASTGKVLRRLVREAAARGAPAGAWTCAFTDEADSNGEAWPDDESMVVTKTGQTYWDVLNMMAEDRYDFAASPAGRTLYVYRKGKGAGSVSQPWAPGVHAESLATRVAGR